MSLSQVLVWCLAAALGLGGPIQQASAPSGGGTVRGRVFVPESPTTAPRPMVGGLGGPSHVSIDRSRVVVYLEATPALTAAGHAPVRARMDQRDEQFVPHLLAITTGSVVEFPNSDTTFHNVFSLSRTRTFDLGRYPPGRNGAVRFDRPGVVPVFCDIHSHMSGYILVFDHAYYTVSDENGRYAIRDIPPGNYALSVWSELGRATSRRITVTADATVDADFEVSRDSR